MQIPHVFRCAYHCVYRSDSAMRRGLSLLLALALLLTALPVAAQTTPEYVAHPGSDPFTTHLEPPLEWEGSTYSLSVRLHLPDSQNPNSDASTPLDVPGLFSSTPAELQAAGLSGLVIWRDGNPVVDERELRAALQRFEQTFFSQDDTPDPATYAMGEPIPFAELLTTLGEDSAFDLASVHAAFPTAQAEATYLMRRIIAPPTPDPLLAAFLTGLDTATGDSDLGALITAPEFAPFADLYLDDPEGNDQILDDLLRAGRSPVGAYTLYFGFRHALEQADVRVRMLSDYLSLFSHSPAEFTSPELFGFLNLGGELMRLERIWPDIILYALEDGAVPGRVSRSEAVEILYFDYSPLDLPPMLLAPLYGENYGQDYAEDYAEEWETPSGTDNFLFSLRMAYLATDLYERMELGREQWVAGGVTADALEFAGLEPNEVEPLLDELMFLVATAANHSFADAIEIAENDNLPELAVLLAWSDAETAPLIAQLRATTLPPARSQSGPYLATLAIETRQELTAREFHPRWTSFSDTRTIAQVVAQGDFIWTVTPGGIVRLHRPTGERAAFSQNDVLPNNAVNRILPGVDGGLWVNSVSEVGLLDAEGNWHAFHGDNTADVASGSTPQAHPVRFTRHPGPVQAHDGSVWFLDTQGQVFRESRDGELQSLGMDVGLPTDQFTRIESGADGSVWLLVSGGPFVRVSPDEQFHIIEPAAEDGDWASAISGSPDGSIWFAFNEFLLQINSQGELTRYDGGSFNGLVREFYFGGENDVWVRDTQGGIHRIDDSEDGLGDPPGEANGFIDLLAATPDGSIWFALESGLGHLTSLGEWSEYPLPPQTTIHAVTLDPASTIWVATDQGLGRLTVDGDWSLFTIADGLPANSIEQLYARRVPGDEDAPDQQGVFLVVEKAIGFFDGVDLETHIQSDGLSQARVNEVHASITGDIWFATPGGLIHYSADGVWTDYALHSMPIDWSIDGIHQTPDGSVWVENGIDALLTRIAPDGSVASYPQEDEFIFYDAVDWTVGPDGEIWVLVSAFLVEESLQLYRLLADDSWEISILPDIGSEYFWRAQITAAPNGNLILWNTSGVKPAILILDFETEIWEVFHQVGEIEIDSLDEGIHLGPDGSLWMTSATTENSIAYYPDGRLVDYPNTAALYNHSVAPIPTLHWFVTLVEDEDEFSVSVLHRDAQGAMNTVLSFQSEQEIASYPLFANESIEIFGTAHGLYFLAEDGIRRLGLDGEITYIPTEVPGDIYTFHGVNHAEDGSFWFYTNNGITRLEMGGMWQFHGEPLPTSQATPGGIDPETPETPGGLAGAHGLAAGAIIAQTDGPDGSRWFLGETQLVRYWPDGLSTEYARPESETIFFDLWFDADGRLWVDTEQGVYQLIS